MILFIHFICSLPLRTANGMGVGSYAHMNIIMYSA